jgi:hypothetical protein
MSDTAEAVSHANAVPMTFSRRIAVIVILILAARAIALTLQLVNVAILAYRLVPSFESAVQIAMTYGLGCAIIAAVLFMLLHAQRSIVAGKSHWLASMPESTLIITLLVLLVLSRIVPRVTWDASMFADSHYAPNSLYFWAMRGIHAAMNVATCYIWIWWCNSPPRGERLVVVSALAWAGFEFLLDVFDLILPSLNIMASRTAEAGNAIHLPGTDTVLTIFGSPWIWRVGAENIPRILPSFAMNMVFGTVVGAVIAVVLYVSLNRDSANPKQL